MIAMLITLATYTVIYISIEGPPTTKLDKTLDYGVEKKITLCEELLEADRKMGIYVDRRDLCRYKYSGDGHDIPN